MMWGIVCAVFCGLVVVGYLRLYRYAQAEPSFDRKGRLIGVGVGFLFGVFVFAAAERVGWGLTLAICSVVIGFGVLVVFRSSLLGKGRFHEQTR